MSYNAAFFSLFENTFKLLKKEFGETKALDLFHELMVIGLSKAYGDNFTKGQPKEFVHIVSERDHMVGLHVAFPDISENRIVYQFHDDPFPNLKGEVSAEKLDKTYIEFKINCLLGDDWGYCTTKHFWWGDHCTEHVITRNSQI